MNPGPLALYSQLGVPMRSSLHRKGGIHHSLSLPITVPAPPRVARSVTFGRPVGKNSGRGFVLKYARHLL